MNISNFVTPQESLADIFKTILNLKGTFSEKIRRLTTSCGFRDIIRKHERDKCSDIGIAGAMLIENNDISRGEFLCLLVLAGITLFTDHESSENIPDGFKAKLECIYYNLQPTANFSCAEILFYVCIMNSIFDLEEELE